MCVCEYTIKYYEKKIHGISCMEFVYCYYRCGEKVFVRRIKQKLNIKQQNKRKNKNE